MLINYNFFGNAMSSVNVYTQIRPDDEESRFHYFHGAAFDSLCTEYKWDFFGVSFNKIRNIVVINSGNPHAGKNALCDLLRADGFKWPEFDKCVQYCVANHKTGWFYEFTKYYPKEPHNLHDLLQLMVYQEICKLAKKLGLSKLHRKKADLIEVVSKATIWENCIELAQSEYKKALQAYHEREFPYKCEALLLSVSVRESALRNLNLYSEYLDNGYKKPLLKLDFDQHPESDDLAKLFLDDGYKSIDGDNLANLDILPPFFPADRSWFNCR